MTKAGRLLGLNDYQHLSRHTREERDEATRSEPNPSPLDGCIFVHLWCCRADDSVAAAAGARSPGLVPLVSRSQTFAAVAIW